MINTEYLFNTPSNYNYDSAKLEIASDKAKLKNLGLVSAYKTSTSARFYAPFLTKDGVWGDGALTGSLTAGASVAAGKLVLLGAGAYCQYSAVGNADTAQTGCIRFKYTPNYSGAPAQAKGLFTIQKTSGYKNMFSLTHVASGVIYAYIYSNSGVQISNPTFGSWSPVSGTEYEFELNWNLTTGATRLFINGVQQGSTSTATGTRDTDVDTLRVGATFAATEAQDSSFDDFIVFTQPQHTTNYTPGANPPYGDYSTDAQYLRPSSFLYLGAIATAAATQVSGDDIITYVAEVDGVKYYWDGGAWSPSSGYAQSNDLATFSANIADLDCSDGVAFKWQAYLKSAYGVTTPEISAVNLGYDFYGQDPTAPGKCIVWGYIYKPDGSANTGVAVSAALAHNTVYNGEVQLGPYSSVSTTTNSEGYWELELIESTAMAPTTPYIFTFTGDTYFEESKKTVPNLGTMQYAELS